jgi:hypothetical protein
MIEPADRLTPATPEDLGDALAFALRFHGRRLAIRKALPASADLSMEGPPLP